MPLTIACRSCRSPLFVRRESLGRTVRCPNCNGNFVAGRADVIADDSGDAPAAESNPARSTMRQGLVERRPAPRPGSSPAGQIICPACHQPMLDDGSLAGQMVECVSCSQVFQVPARGQRRATPKLQPTGGSSPATTNLLIGGGILAFVTVLVVAVVVLYQKGGGPQVAQQPPADQLVGSVNAPVEQKPTVPAPTTVATPVEVRPSEPVQSTSLPPPAVTADPLASAVPPPSSTESLDLPPAGSSARPSDPVAPVQGTVKEIVDRVDPSIVRISIPGIGLGSGFVLDEKGTIITNYHVIEGAPRATVVFSDKTQVEATGFTAILPDMDLAALQITPPRALKPLPLARSRPAKGEQVLAFGAPQGLSFSVSDGIVSAVRPASEVQEILKETTGRDVYRLDLGYSLDMTWIQTSTPISPGNSGGPLVNLSGEVVGINTWSRSGENLNFAISAEQIAVLLQRATGSVQPFGNLPKPRAGQVHQISKAQSERTRQYWDKIYEAHQAMLTSAKKEKKKLADGPKWLANAARLRKFAVTIKKLDVRDVDLDLVLITTRLAQNVEEIATALEDGANALPKGKLDTRTARSSSYRSAVWRYESATSSNRRLCEKFDYLRIAYIALYGGDFRVIFDVTGDETSDGLTKDEKSSPN